MKKHDLTIKQANGEDLPFAIPWRDVYKVSNYSYNYFLVLL